MNIVIAGIAEFDPQIGGTERVSVILADCLLQHGFGVFFVGVEKYPDTKPYTPIAEQIFLPNESEMSCGENIHCFVNFVVEKKIDVILNQFGNHYDFSILCAGVRERTGVKLLSAIHTDPEYVKKLYQSDISLLETPSWLIRQIKSGLKKTFTFRLKQAMKEFSTLYSYIYRESDAVILLSERFKPVFKKMAGLSETSKLEAIPNILSFPPTSESFPKEKQILWVGRFDSLVKRPERMLRIWSYLEKRHPDWNVMFVGDGPCKPLVEQYIKRLGLKNVLLTGHSNPINACKKSSILCMTSTFEGFGLVLTEAMQFGAVPMAFSSFESVFDIIEDGITGYVIQPFDLKLYAQRLEFIMMESRQREIMAKNAQKFVNEKFSDEHITEKWISLFNKIINHCPC